MTTCSTPDVEPLGRHVDRDVERHLAAVRARIDAALDHADQQARGMTHRLTRSPLLEASDLSTCIRDLVAAGGKLVRPRLVLLGYLAGLDAARGGQGPHEHVDERGAEHLARLGAAFELLHVFGLLQDDVMDASATRRGAPSAHRRVADAARAARPAPIASNHLSAEATTPEQRGPGAPADDDIARRAGESIAVLAGDLAFALAQREVRPLPEVVTQAWDATVMELVGGQRLDIVLAAEGRFDEEATALVAQAKSGAYTVSRPLEAGALLAAPNRTVPTWLAQYGERIGAAFALADDVIGIWGDPDVTGKPAGDDLVERKPSSVVGIADTMLDGELSRLLGPGAPRLDDDATAALVSRLTRAGVRDEALARIDENLGAAMDSTDAIVSPDVRAAFVEMARTLANRSA